MEFSALHEHLDGGLRAKTIIDIATSKNIDLPLDDEKELENWFYENISTEKNQVFKKFEMTISVMQDTNMQDAGLGTFIYPIVIIVCF